MESRYMEMDRLIYWCFDLLKGEYTREQSFNIILGLSSVHYLNVKEQSTIGNLNSLVQDGYYENMLKNRLKELGHYNKESCELFTKLFEPVFNYRNTAVTHTIIRIMQELNKFTFNDVDEIVEFINRLVVTSYIDDGIYGTPDAIKKLVLELVDFKYVHSFADYCSGVSSVAIEVFRHLKTLGYVHDVFYYGEEKNVSAHLISKLLMIVNGIEHSKIINKDVLEEGGVGTQIEKFDFVFSDAPFGISWNKNEAINDPRYKYGIPAKSSADWAFFQNALYHMQDNGKAIVVGTKGTLVRSSEVGIRKAIIDEDLIEAIITLPTNLYHATNVGTELIVFNKNKKESRRQKILFIDASEYSYRLNRNQHSITKEGITKIIDTYRDGSEEDRFSRFVEVDKIREYNYGLNPKEYLDVDILKNTFQQTVLLGEIAEIRRGVQLSKEEYDFLSLSPDYYLINIKDIENGKISYDEESKITYKKPDWLEKFAIRPMDILITCKGSLVKTAIVEDKDKDRKAFISGNLSIIRVNTQKYNPYVLYEFLQSEIGLRMLDGIQTGTTIKLLNPSRLEQLEIPYFTLDVLNEIGCRIKQNKNEYEATIEEAEKKYSMKKRLLIKKLGFDLT
ncbi:N-6 DNA methylase [Aneurinibacillus aneurinilyticus]|uniref:N-6 DNA methylase n=1 Tax=Aneurinibacillus aneurinilyticus TaxID=1391 RepID=UPI0035248204